MSKHAGFDRFFDLDERDAPNLFQRLTKRELAVDGERYGVFSRLIAERRASVADLGVAVLKKLLASSDIDPRRLGAVVLSSRAVNVQRLAEKMVSELGLTCPAQGVERACSGFPAATEEGLRLCRETQRPIAIVLAEIISTSINWEAAEGDLSDHRRARGQASKLFGDGAAAVLIHPPGRRVVFEILDAWAGEVADEQQLIQKATIENTYDPWGHVRAGETDCISMPGRRGFLLVRRAPKIMASAVAASFERAREGGLLGEESVSHVVPHQANGLIISRLQQQLTETEDPPPVVWDCIRDTGNTVSASIPLAMSQVQDKLPGGMLIGMPSVGAGGPGYRPHVLSTGCVLVRKTVLRE